MKSWTLDPACIRPAPFDLPFTPMQEQQPLPPVPLLPLREQAEFWAEEMRFPQSAMLAWLKIAGVGRKWRELAASPAASEPLDALGSWRPSPKIWTNYSIIPDSFAAPADSRPDALARAAQLVLAARQVHADFVNRRLKPECAGRHHLDLSQMANVFRGIGVFQDKPRWCCPPDGLDYFCVLVRGRPCFLPMPSAADDVPAIRAALAEVVADVHARNEPSLAPLSATGLQELKFAGPNKPEDLALLVNMIGAARLVLCLDLDSAPADACRMGYLSQVTFTNRWYLHGCNLVVFGNGAMGIHLSFGVGIDGNVGARFASELAERFDQMAREAAPSTAPCAPYSAFIRAPPVTMTPRMESRLLANATAWIKTSPCVFTLPLGETACSASGARPVDTFIIALAKTLSDLGGSKPGRPCRIPIRQFISQGRYKFGTLNATDVNTPEVLAVAQLLQSPAPDTDQPAVLRGLYSTAEESIKRRTEIARQARKFNKRLTQGAVRRVLGYLAVAPFLLVYRTRLRLTQPHTAITAAAISYVSKKDGIAIVARPGARAPRGMLWLHYQIYADRTVVLPCVGADCPFTEAALAEQLAVNWKHLLDRLTAKT
jgi:hypothetical protein